jgi:hypothetical protein
MMVDLKVMAYFKISLSTRNWDRAKEKGTAAWPYSTVHHYAASGISPPNWCGMIDQSRQKME